MMYKGIRLNNIIDKEPTLKFKLPNYVSEKTLGNFNPYLNFATFEKEYEIIIDVKRIIMYCIELMKFGWEMSFDQVFSHVASHEYMHYILLTQIGKYENECFDNIKIFGVVNHNPKYVHSGIKFEGDPPYLYILPKRHSQLIKLVLHAKITFCHIYTKIINSIRNKVGSMKKILEKIDNKIEDFLIWLHDPIRIFDLLIIIGTSLIIIGFIGLLGSW